MFESQSTGRLRVVVRVAVVWAALILAKLAYLQIWQHKEFVRIANQQQQKQLEIQGARGTIYDRTGQPLAKSLPVDSVCVNPLTVPDFTVASEILAKVLNLDAAEIYSNIKLAAEKNHGFLWIKRRIDPDESARLRSLKLDWIEFRSESRRFYPNDRLAAHAVGGVDHAERGNAGLELSLDKELAGHVGEVRMMTDAKPNAYASEVETKPLAGKDIVTTIDGRIQSIAERELAAAAISSHAKSGSVVAINPRNGEILALANWPTYDPNDPMKKGESQVPRNDVAVTTPYEPGSVFKVVTLAAALETTKLRPETPINCGMGILRLGSRVIHDTHRLGVISMAEVLAQSSNIGAIQIGMTVGSDKMYEYMHRFGFGAQTGIPLPSESTGLVRKLERWGKTSLASVSMGHEVSVTAVQLAQACTVIASGGMLIRPKLILSRQRGKDPAEMEPDVKQVRVIRPETAFTMRRMMEGVVLHGTGKRYARIKGYSSGGKTGTGKIFDFSTHQYTTHYNASFMGFAPVTNPAIVIAVTLIGTSGGDAAFGGPVAAPVFREVATAALRILDVPKDLPEDLPTLKDEPIDSRDLSIAGLDPSVGPELVASASPSLVQGPPAPDQPLFAMVARNTVGGPRVPDFGGKTMRDVLEEAAASGTPVELAGRGIARTQFPPPGAALPAGEKVRIQFAR